MFIKKEKKISKNQTVPYPSPHSLLQLKPGLLVSTGRKWTVMWYQKLWPELEQYVLQCLETPSNFMVHTELGPFKIQVGLILKKHISHLTMRNGKVKAGF